MVSASAIPAVALLASVSGDNKIVNISSTAWRGSQERSAAAGVDKKSYHQLGDRCRIRAALSPAVDPSRPTGGRC